MNRPALPLVPFTGDLADKGDVYRWCIQLMQSYGVYGQAVDEYIASITIPPLATTDLSAASLVELFRWTVLKGYGFNGRAVNILKDAPLYIKDFTSADGGGLTYHDHIELNGLQHEAALHEMEGSNSSKANGEDKTKSLASFQSDVGKAPDAP